MRLKDYKTKLIVLSDEKLLIDKTLPIEIEDKIYDFRILDIKGPLIEIGVCKFPFSLLEISEGQEWLENIIKELEFDEFFLNVPYDIKGYEEFFTENFFFEFGARYNLKMYITFSEIDKSNKPFEKKLRDKIVSTYEDEMRNDPNLKNRFEKVLENDKIEQTKKEENLKETRKKEKKIQEIEQEFDFYKPMDKSRYKIR